MNALVQVVAGLGFVLAWLGCALLIGSMVIPFVFNRTYWRKVSGPYSDFLKWSGESMHAQIQTIGRSRTGRAGMVLLAIGTSLLLLAGIAWLFIQIAENQGSG